MAKKSMPFLGVRFEEHILEQLKALAEREEKPLVQLVRETMTERLDREAREVEEQSETNSEELIQLLLAEITEARKDIAVAAEALLVDAGSVEIELASKWVRANLKRE